MERPIHLYRQHLCKSKKGDKYCRAVVNCSMCHSVSGIDIVEASEMTRDMVRTNCGVHE